MVKENFESSTSSGSQSEPVLLSLNLAHIEDTISNMSEKELTDYKDKIINQQSQFSSHTHTHEHPHMSESTDKLTYNWVSNKEQYNLSTKYIMDTHKKLKDLREIEEHHHSLMMNNNDKLDDIDNINMTSKRHIEINMNIIRKNEYIIKIFKIMLIVVVVLLLIPILSKVGTINKTTSIMIWGLFVFIILLVMLYLVYYKNISKDKNDYNKFNFINPNSQEVARSKLNVDLSETDQARCQAFAEVQDIYDTNDIQASEFDEYKNNDTSKCLSK